jgi:hypothetical protein
VQLPEIHRSNKKSETANQQITEHISKMRYSTAVVLAALSVAEVVVAGPTHAHLHRHRDVHVKKE